MSMMKKWIPPKSPVGMLQEDLWPDEWKILVACILHNQTSRKQVDKVYPSLFDKYPSASVMASCDQLELADLLRPLGLHNRRSASLKKFSKQYSEQEWSTPSDLFACGKYADDCYSVFCTGDWRAVETTDGSLSRYIIWLESENA